MNKSNALLAGMNATHKRDNMKDYMWEPDCFDLQAWVIKHHAQFYEAIRFLHPEYQYKAMRMYWEKLGCPGIE